MTSSLDTGNAEVVVDPDHAEAPRDEHLSPKPNIEGVTSSLKELVGVHIASARSTTDSTHPSVPMNVAPSKSTPVAFPVAPPAAPDAPSDALSKPAPDETPTEEIRNSVPRTLRNSTSPYAAGGSGTNVNDGSSAKGNLIARLSRSVAY